MRDTDKLKGYRAKYKRHYGINFDSGYVIHHIDGNRQNNDINNLLLLPLSLHSKYHEHKKQVEMMMVDGICFDLTNSGNAMFQMQMHYLNKYVEVVAEIQEWIGYKHLEDMGYSAYSQFRGE